MLPAPFLPPAELGSYHGCLTQSSKAQQGTAIRPFPCSSSATQAAAVQPGTLQPGKNEAAKDSGLTRLHQRCYLAHPKHKNCSLKLNLQRQRSR